MKIPEAIRAILQQGTVNEAVESLVEADRGIRALERAWKERGDPDSLKALVKAFSRQGRNWVEERFEDDLFDINRMLKKRGWFNSHLSDKTTKPMHGTPNWRSAMIYMMTNNRDDAPWPEFPTKHQGKTVYQIWTLALYYPTPSYIERWKKPYEMYWIPRTLRPKDGLSTGSLSDEVKDFEKEFKKKFPTKVSTQGQGNVAMNH